MKNQQRLGELNTATPPATSAPFQKQHILQHILTWPWIALGGRILGICVLGGLALVIVSEILVIVSELSGELAADVTQWQTAPPNAEVPFYFPDVSADSGMDMGSDTYAPMPNYDFGGSTSSDFSLGNTDGLAKSIRKHSNENSWWAEEWSRALGDNYSEGNPGWIDHSGAFHDYNSGMSDYKSSTLGGGYKQRVRMTRKRRVSPQ